MKLRYKDDASGRLSVFFAACMFFRLGLMIFTGGISAGACMLWLLAAFAAVTVLRNARVHETPSGHSTAWAMLFCAAISALFLPAAASTWGVFIVVTAVCCYYGGFAVSAGLLPSIFIITVALPSAKYLFLLLSLPLGRVCAWLTAALLRLCGVYARCENAVIFAGGNNIAVTAACSGIELLEAMLFCGWLIVYFENKGALARLLHYSSLLPIIIFCNTARLTVVSLVSLRNPDFAFGEPFHQIMGYATAFAVAILLAAIGMAFRFEQDGDGRESSKTGGNDAK